MRSVRLLKGEVVIDKFDGDIYLAVSDPYYDFTPNTVNPRILIMRQDGYIFEVTGDLKYWNAGHDLLD
jgi:hypothetical protein